MKGHFFQFIHRPSGKTKVNFNPSFSPFPIAVDPLGTVGMALIASCLV